MSGAVGRLAALPAPTGPRWGHAHLPRPWGVQAPKPRPVRPQARGGPEVLALLGCCCGLRVMCPLISPQATPVAGSGALRGREVTVDHFRPHGGARHWHHTPPPGSQFCNMEPLRMACLGPVFAVAPVSAIETGLAPTPGRASAAKVEHDIATPRKCRPRSQKNINSRPELPGW